MKRVLFAIIFAFNALGLQAQSPVIWKIDDLLKAMSPSGDTLYVINFWATWCKPCVAELPHFDAAEAHFAGKPVKVLLVSLDFRNEYESKLVPFVQKRALRSQVALLDEPDYNSWIDRVSPNWSGAIPATCFVKQGMKIFHEGELSEQQLHQFIEEYLKHQP